MGDQPVPVIVTPIPNGLKLYFSGQIHTQAEWAGAELDRAVKAKPKNVELDLAGIEFIASAGLGMLVSFRNRIVEAGGTIKTVAVHPRVLEVLKMSRLITLFNVEQRSQ